MLLAFFFHVFNIFYASQVFLMESIFQPISTPDLKYFS